MWKFCGSFDRQKVWCALQYEVPTPSNSRESTFLEVELVPFLETRLHHLEIDMYLSTCRFNEFSNLVISIFFACAGMAMKEHIILMDMITDQFAWLKDETCERNRLVGLRVTTKDHVSGFKCNPFSGFCRQ